MIYAVFLPKPLFFLFLQVIIVSDFIQLRSRSKQLLMREFIRLVAHQGSEAVNDRG